MVPGQVRDDRTGDHRGNEKRDILPESNAAAKQHHPESFGGRGLTGTNSSRSVRHGNAQSQAYEHGTAQIPRSCCQHHEDRGARSRSQCLRRRERQAEDDEAQASSIATIPNRVRVNGPSERV